MPHPHVSTAKKPVINPYGVLLLGVLFVSFGSLFSRLAAAPPLSIAFYRMFFAALLLAPAAAVRSLQEIASLKRREWLLLMFSGMFLAFHFFSWISSLFYTTVASSTILVTIHPLLVVSSSALFFKERLPRRAIAAGVVAFCGVMLIGWGDFQLGLRALRGDLLAVCGAALMGGYLMIGRKLRQRLSLLCYTFLVYGIASLVLFAMVIISHASLTHFSLNTWMFLLALAVVPTIGGHNLFNWALAYVPAPVVSFSILGEPVGASIFAFLFLGETPGLQQIVGIVIIMTGLIWFLAEASAK